MFASPLFAAQVVRQSGERAAGRVGLGDVDEAAQQGAQAVTTLEGELDLTSASGEIFTKACVLLGAGVSEVTSILAVDVGVRWSVSGCD